MRYQSDTTPPGSSGPSYPGPPLMMTQTTNQAWTDLRRHRYGSDHLVWIPPDLRSLRVRL